MAVIFITKAADTKLWIRAATQADFDAFYVIASLTSTVSDALWRWRDILSAATRFIDAGHTIPSYTCDVVIPTSDPVEAEEIQLLHHSQYRQLSLGSQPALDKYETQSEDEDCDSEVSNDSDALAWYNKTARGQNEIAYREYVARESPPMIEGSPGEPDDTLDFKLPDERSTWNERIRQLYSEVHAASNRDLTSQNNAVQEQLQFARWMFPFTYHACAGAVQPSIWVQNRLNNLGRNEIIEAHRQTWIAESMGHLPTEPLNELQLEMRYFVNILFHSSFLLIPNYYVRDVERTRGLVQTMNDALASLNALLNVEDEIQV
ncbi:hypothetical protein SCHPADRAFT_896305 [Schizopora paradoxa]|uniref:Uncharacterized protein n=1 Tax=Schizopora paradoxa TaxID=27342 RepID=A0A0H2RKP8_9AGAM|nr:hypothetical protein SCHPADRAFT_896305 [Schizopora paradoxa]